MTEKSVGFQPDTASRPGSRLSSVPRNPSPIVLKENYMLRIPNFKYSQMKRRSQSQSSIKKAVKSMNNSKLNVGEFNTVKGPKLDSRFVFTHNKDEAFAFVSHCIGFCQYI